MRWLIPALAAVVVLGGCGKRKCGNGAPNDGGDDTGIVEDTGPQAYPSGFDSGQYRMTTLTLLDTREGLDLDGDGVPDNNLPNALKPIDLLLPDYDLTVAGFNQTVAYAILDGQLIVLFEADHDYPVLELDLLGGRLDALGYVEVDPDSYDDAGAPRSHLEGWFDTDSSFRAGPAPAFVPMAIFPGSDPVDIPIEEMRVEGRLDSGEISGTVAGIIPSEELVDDVIATAIDPGGYDANGDGVIDYTYDQLIDLFHGFAENENISDMELSDGRLGVSIGFRFTGYPTTF